LFTIQIYCDFSGYSDIAIGTGKILGFEIPKNFERPFLATSVTMTWRRWHISLSTWFKDYLYIPLGGNRVKISRLYFNIFFVFMVSGFWHGANWTFIIWGALHGFYLIIAEIRKKFFNQLVEFDFLNIFFNFILVSFAWIFFRANSLDQVFQICGKIFMPLDTNYFQIYRSDLHGQPDTILGLAKWKFVASLSVIPILFFCDYLIMTKKVNVLIKKPPIYSWSIYYILIIIILLFGVFDTKQFIYFQF
jgi:D-alanyl-lipoteichoic acid acyltransferase DltB (MBOAT superfamily)